MKNDVQFRSAIEAALKIMHRLLVSATEDTRSAWVDITRHGQNTAIGALLPVEQQLDQAMALYKAVIAMHRCEPQEEPAVLKSLSSDLPTRYDDYEVHGVKEFEQSSDKWCEQVDDQDADFWSLYGHIPGEGVYCIGDFRSRECAEEVYARITGCRYTDGGSV